MSRLDELKALLLENPDDNFISYALALELAKLNRTEEAITMLEQLIEHDKDYLAAYYQLGKLYEMNHENEKAKLAFSNGVEVAKKKKDQRTMNELNSALELLDD